MNSSFLAMVSPPIEISGRIITRDAHRRARRPRRLREPRLIDILSTPAVESPHPIESACRRHAWVIRYDRWGSTSQCHGRGAAGCEDLSSGMTGTARSPLFAWLVPAALVVALAAVVTVGNVVWLKREMLTLPPSWDQ